MSNAEDRASEARQELIASFAESPKRHAYATLAESTVTRDPMQRVALAAEASALAMLAVVKELEKMSNTLGAISRKAKG